MAHQTTITATNSPTVTQVTFNGLVTGHSIGVSITPLVSSGGNSSVGVSSTTNCSATPTSITVTASSGTYSATFSNLYIYVAGVATIYAYTTISGTITAATSPPTHVTLTAAGTQEQSTTYITATTWGGTTGGTLLVSGTPFTTWVTNGYSWSGKTRGTSYTFKGKRVLNGVDSTYASSSITVPYLAATQSGALTAATIAYAASTSYTIGFTTAVPSTHDYRINSGTVNSASVTVPATAGTHAFSLQTRRKVASGGDGSTWSSSFGSVNITRSAATSAPTHVGCVPGSHNAATTTVTATTWGGTTGGTLYVSDDNGSTWQANGYAFPNKNRNASYTFKGKRVVSGVDSTYASTTLTVPYLATSTAGTISASPTNPAYDGSTSTITVSIGNKAAGHNYYVDGVAIGSATSVSKTLPAAGGSQATYVLTVVRPTTYGGNGSTVSDGSVTVTRQADLGSAPSISGVTNNSNPGTTVTSTVSLSSSGSGGTLQYAQTSSNSVTGASWQTSSATSYAFTQARNTTKYYWARQSATLVGAVESHAVGYLTGDTSVSATNDTISSSASSASTTISNGTSGETYAVRLNNGSTNIVTRVGNGSLTIPSASLPTGTTTTTYEIFVRRPTSTGGDGSTYTATNDTFTVNRQAAGGGGGTSYGLQVRNASDQLVLEVSDRVSRFVSTGSSSYTTGSSPISVTVTGMANNDTWAVVVNSTVPYGGVEVVKGTNSFTMKQTGIAAGGQAATLRYIVLRT